jgi:hypothetical protein
VSIMLPNFAKEDFRTMDFNHKLQKQAADAGLLGPQPVERPIPPPTRRIMR